MAWQTQSYVRGIRTIFSCSTAQCPCRKLDQAVLAEDTKHTAKPRPPGSPLNHIEPAIWATLGVKKWTQAPAGQGHQRWPHAATSTRAWQRGHIYLRTAFTDSARQQYLPTQRGSRYKTDDGDKETGRPNVEKARNLRAMVTTKIKERRNAHHGRLM